MEKRRYISSICAPLVGTLVACLAFVVTGLRTLTPTNASPVWGEQSAHMLGLYLLFGLPLAYLLELLALRLVRFHTPTMPSLRHVATVATSLGGALVFGTWALIFDARFGLLTMPSGLAGGLAAGVTWWLLEARTERRAGVV